MRRWSRSGAMAALVLSLGLFSGCVRQSREGNTTVYSMELWVGGLTTLGGLAAVPAGVALRKSNTRGSIVLILLGLGLLIVVAPNMFLDSTKVDAEHFESRHGFWFSPTIHNIRFDEMASIHRTKEVRRGRRGRKTTNYYLDITKTSGQSERVPLGTIMSEAEPEVIRHALERGIPISGDE